MPDLQDILNRIDYDLRFGSDFFTKEELAIIQEYLEKEINLEDIQD